jgi:hypothetical protein
MGSTKVEGEGRVGGVKAFGLGREVALLHELNVGLDHLAHQLLSVVGGDGIGLRCVSDGVWGED